MSNFAVPYCDGMELGQGFNTFTQTLARKDAVTFSGSQEEAPAGLTCSFTLVKDIDDLLKVLGVSPGSVIRGDAIMLGTCKIDIQKVSPILLDHGLIMM